MVHHVACQQPQKTRRLSSAGPMLAHRLRRWPRIKPAVVQSLVFAGLRSIVWLTAGGDYKPTPTQCMLNVGPASPVLASIHSVLVSTSCCRYWCNTPDYTHYTPV